MLEHAGGGGSEACPIAKKVYDVLYGIDTTETDTSSHHKTLQP